MNVLTPHAGPSIAARGLLRGRRPRRFYRCGGPGSRAAPSLLSGRLCRRGTAFPRRRPFGGLRYPLNMKATHAIGVDLGGTKILAGVATRDGEVVRRHERPTPQDAQESVVRELEAAVAELLTGDTGAIGFGVPA